MCHTYIYTHTYLKDNQRRIKMNLELVSYIIATSATRVNLIRSDRKFLISFGTNLASRLVFRLFGKFAFTPTFSKFVVIRKYDFVSILSCHTLLKTMSNALSDNCIRILILSSPCVFFFFLVLASRTNSLSRTNPSLSEARG